METNYRYDEQGRLIETVQGNLRVTFQYHDVLGLLQRIATTDIARNVSLVKQLEYDHRGREVCRTQTLGNQPPRILEQVWQADGQLESRHLHTEGNDLLREKFVYDARGRLLLHQCEGSELPQDRFGRAISEQLFLYDGLDNLYQKTTTFADGTEDEAQYHFNANDPCQLESVVHTDHYPREIEFKYDADGNMLNDEDGQALSYDPMGRLVSVHNSNGPVSSYRYDAHDHLVAVRQGTASETLRFYRNEQLTLTVQDELQTQFLYSGRAPLGQQTAGAPETTRLLHTNASGSVIGESEGEVLTPQSYSAYGERAENGVTSLLGFNGEVRDPASGWYLLGRGYRAYNPSLMRFHSPDSMSPFGEGGINPYVYCLGNPIAYADPSGHRSISFQSIATWVMAAAVVVLAAAAFVPSGGASAAATAAAAASANGSGILVSLWAGTTAASGTLGTLGGVATVGAAIGSGITEATVRDEHKRKMYAWTAFAIASVGTGIFAFGYFSATPALAGTEAAAVGEGAAGAAGAGEGAAGAAGAAEGVAATEAASAAGTETAAASTMTQGTTTAEAATQTTGNALLTDGTTTRIVDTSQAFFRSLRYRPPITTPTPTPPPTPTPSAAPAVSPTGGVSSTNAISEPAKLTAPVSESAANVPQQGARRFIGTNGPNTSNPAAIRNAEINPVR